MLIVGLIISLIGLCLENMILNKTYNINETLEMISGCMTIVSSAVLLASIVGIIYCSYSVSKLQVADAKINMYIEENQKIQDQISTIVENYKNYEKNTYTEIIKNIDIKNTDVLVLSQLFPDIKTNDLVSTQMQTYIDNNNKIKELKEEKINHQVDKWWLYFGKIE